MEKLRNRYSMNKKQISLASDQAPNKPLHPLIIIEESQSPV